MLDCQFAKRNLPLGETRLYDNPEDMPYLVEYICSNVPLKGFPVNCIYAFVEDASNLFGAMLTPGLIKVPVIVYRVSETLFNFFNYKLELIGGMAFSKDFQILKTFGSDFEKKSGFMSFRLLNLAYDYSATDALIIKKFDNTKIYYPKRKV